MSLQDHLQPGEEVLYRAHVTRLALAPLWALLALILAGAAYLWFGLQNAPGALTALALAALVGIVLGVKLLILRANEYVLTSHRVIRNTGLLNKQSMDSRLDKVNNIEHSQTLWGRLFNYGDVEIDTASETGMAMFRNISHPLDFKRAIAATAEQYRSANRGGYVAAPAGPSGAERLRQLKALFDDGLISREEFEAKRQQLVSEL
ncbi:MAG TPA: PH domain-containing protein [Thermoanaerobaculia bacterium]|nr:PH domain-containing protein [Thermoanaerobaculia bacterium]